jgi:hypothetical protein
MPPVLTGGAEQWQQHPAEQLLPQQQQQQQRDSYSSPLPPTLDEDLLHLQQQLAGSSLQSYVQQATATHSGSNSSAGRLNTMSISHFSNSEQLQCLRESAAPPPGGIPLHPTLEDDIAKLLRVSRVGGAQQQPF